ncbi:MAG: cation:proton antiporter [Alkalibacterium sp.]|nr:cation:proton antiporter [Alkalibacterium sp.]
MTYSIYIAILLLAGLGAGKLAKKVRIPTVTGYILCGLVLGPSVFNLITSEVYYSLSFVNELALGMLALSVGTELHYRVFKAFGKNLIILSIGNTLFTGVLVSVLTWLAGMPIPYALILAPLAMSVAPSGVVSVVKEKKAQGEMTQNLLGLVAFDNLITILAFGVMVAFIQSFGNEATSGIVLIGLVILDIFLALLVGVVSGVFISYFVRSNTANDSLVVLLLAALLLNSGIAFVYGLSPILTNLTAGVAISNLTSRKVLIASLLDRIEMPIFILFLTLAGAHLDVAILGQVGLAGAAYIVARFLGKYFGILLFSSFTRINKKVRYNLGLGLLPHAGVAIGLASIAERSLPQVSGADNWCRTDGGSHF